MTIYTLICQSDTDNGNDVSVKLFAKEEDAILEMQKQFDEALPVWGFNDSDDGRRDYVGDDLRYAVITKSDATIRDDIDYIYWHVEHTTLDLNCEE